jgi:hypothetical protein
MAAQTVVVQLLNGRNGKPIAKARVYIILGDPKDQQLQSIFTNAEGELQFEAGGAKTFQVRPVGEVSCGEQPIGVPIRDYSIDRIMDSGLVTKNDCGSQVLEPRRGRLLYIVRPATWWELFKN